MADFFERFQERYQQHVAAREPEYQRSFFERVFAPFQAPQEALFKFTLEVADDGFQIRDLWSAISHGARYFNPFSNEKPTDPDEVRRVFFGDEASDGVKLAQNLAISLLYDPLLVGGFTKALGLAGRTANTIDKLMNPASLVIDGMRVASERVVGPLARTAAVRILGEEKATDLAIRFTQNFVNRYAGIDPELVREAMAKDSRIHRWREEGFRLIKKSQQLGGAEAHRLLAEALQLDAAWMRHIGEELTPRMAKDLDLIERRIERLGIDRDLFWQTWEQFRNLDDRIGRELMNLGLISETAYKEMRGTHLRRIYMAYENPLEYAKRIEDLPIPDELRVNRKLLYKNLNQFRDDVSKWHGGGPLFSLSEMVGGGPAAQRYFSDSNRFNVRAFVDDFDTYLRENSTASIDEVLDHVKNNMMGGVQLPDEFLATLANYVSNALYNPREVANTMASFLRNRAYNTGYIFRPLKERIEVVANRMDIPEEVRQAMGEILEAAPRMASQVSETSLLMETRRFFDTMAGVKRIDDQAADLIRRAEQLGFSGAEAEALMRQAAERVGVSLDELVAAIPTFQKEGVGTVVVKRGTGWASFGEMPNRAKGHTVQLRGEDYGELDGAWVSPAVATMLRHVEGIAIGDPVNRMAHKTLELLARGVSHFKVMKVVLDPVAQVRNFIGNAVLMDISGTSPLRVDLLKLAANELRQYARTGEMGRYLKLADEAGVYMFQTTFSRNELRDIAQVAIAPDRITNWRDFFTHVHAVIQKNRLDPVEKMAGAFEFNERLFKMTVFIDRMQRLESAAAKAGKVITDDMRRAFARQAGSIAEQALFNYADVPYMVDFARKYGLAPFITFPFKAIPFVAETLYQHPHRVLRYERATEAWNEHWAGSSIDVAREIEGLPEHIREHLVLRMPFNDNAGRPLYLDLSYFMPWTVLKDLVDSFKPSEDRGGGAGFREGFLNPPAMAIIDAIRFNRDSSGNPIVDPNRSPTDNFMALGSFLWKFIAPPSVPGGSRGESIGRAMMAMATNHPEPQSWEARVARAVGEAYRGSIPSESPILPGFGFPEADEQVMVGPNRAYLPQTQAQLQSEGILQALGLAQGVLMGGLVASDVPQQMHREAVNVSVNRSEAFRQIAAIRADPALSISEKNRRIQLILQRLQQSQQQSAERFATLGGR